MQNNPSLAMPSVTPYFASGLIDTFVGNCASTVIVGEQEVPVKDFEAVRSLTPYMLKRVAVLCASIKEIRDAHDFFVSSGVDLVPYIHVEQDTDGGEDWVALISEAALSSEQYSARSPALGFYKTGKHRPFDVTIIVPVYGVEAYVEKCAISLRDQKFTGRAQILFIDDGSKDSSADIVRRVIAGHPHMHLISKPNGGAASARNFAMNLAEGEYIGFVDGDDYVSPDYLESMTRAAFLEDSDVAQADFAHVNAATGEVTPHREWYATKLGACGPIVGPAYQLMLQTPGIWRRLYKSSFLAANNISFNEDFRRHDDLPFNIEVLTKAGSVAISRSTVYFYLLGRDGQDVGATDERLFIHFRLFSFTKERLGAWLWEQDYAATYLITLFSHHKWAYERINADLQPRYLKGMGVQVFREGMPIGLYGRLKILLSFFRNDRRLVFAALWQAIISRDASYSLPSDV